MSLLRCRAGSFAFSTLLLFLTRCERLRTSPWVILGSDAQRDNCCQCISVMKMPKHLDGLVPPSLWVSPQKGDELQRTLIFL